jgi:hypothetical protein
MRLPARFADARDHSLVSELAETDAAQTEVAHEASTAATLKTAILSTSTELWGARCAIFC